MINIWSLHVPLSTYLLFAGDAPDGRPLITVNYAIASSHIPNLTKGFYSALKTDSFSSSAELVLLRSDFDVDYFQWGPSIFVSEQLRRAMALSPAAVRYFEIDDSKSAPLPRSKAYQIMEPQASEDVSDPEKSDYRMSALLPGEPPTPSLHGGMALRPGVAPRHDLFYDGFFADELLCTEALAARAAAAGCTGMQFRDPTSRQER